jgi:hypothetical protein
MTPKEKAEQLVHTYRMLFMDIGEDYGEEILVSVLSKQCAIAAVKEIRYTHYDAITTMWWNDVEQEINKL